MSIESAPVGSEILDAGEELKFATQIRPLDEGEVLHLIILSIN